MAYKVDMWKDSLKSRTVNWSGIEIFSGGHYMGKGAAAAPQCWRK